VSGTALPSGTVTFLFTDVEGSTRLLAEHGDRYAELLDEHRRLLREAFAAHGGVEVDTQGDAFFIAFARASDALAAAEGAQRALAGTLVSVRMGVHTGEPQLTDEGYVGMDVHRGSRIAASGHGGQVLVSEQTARLVDSARLRDLGVHRLKDVGDVRVYQLGDDDFPPLKTLHQTNLPTSPNPLVGRMKELVDVVRLLALERARVVTLTGPGGTGKTRFSLAAAAEVTDAFTDGTWFVDLSAVREPELVIPTIAAALGSQVDLQQHVGEREMLVVLDNLEQVIESARDLGQLVAACPRLQLLVTSRERLNIAPEREYPLKPLPESPAVELFRQRARVAAANGEVDYEVAAEICDRVDHLPLAIELAAARVKVLDPPALLERLERRLPLLASRSRDLPERHRTLRSTIAWSYELLSPEERELFRRLAAFAGGATIEAVKAICEAELDLLESLVDKSLLRRRGSRFVMLETIREFASAELDESEEGDCVQRRHAEFFLALAMSANLTAEADGEQDHELVVGEQGNLRAALDWALETGEIELGLRLAIAAENFWATHSPVEGQRRTAALLARAREDVPAKLRADALRTCASAIYITGDYELGTRYIEESLEEYRRLGEEWGIGHMLLRLAVEAHRVGDRERARALAGESLERTRRAGYRRGEPTALTVLAHLDFEEGEAERGMELLERSARVSGEIGFTWWQAGALNGLAERALELGRLDDAARWARECLALVRRIGGRQMIVVGVALAAAIAAQQGRIGRAGRLWGAVEAEELRGPIGQWEVYRDEFRTKYLAIDEESFQAGCLAGRTLALDDALEEALADD
jgi:predicted ATPase